MERNSLCQPNFLMKERGSHNLKNNMLTEGVRSYCNQCCGGNDQNSEIALALVCAPLTYRGRLVVMKYSGLLKTTVGMNKHPYSPDNLVYDSPE